MVVVGGITKEHANLAKHANLSTDVPSVGDTTILPQVV